MVPRGEPLVGLYRKIVDEKLIRKDLFFGEMAHLALSYARDEGIGAAEAVSSLYASGLNKSGPISGSSPESWRLLRVPCATPKQFPGPWVWTFIS
jgi:hypothetical protein